MKRSTFAFAFLMTLFFCSTTYTADNETQVSNAFSGVMQDRTANSPAEALFVEKCSMCHRQMGMGTVLLSRRLGPEQAMLEQRRDLDGALIEFAVRKGINNMPPISRGEVSDQQLDTIIKWLTQNK